MKCFRAKEIELELLDNKEALRKSNKDLEVRQIYICIYVRITSLCGVNDGKTVLVIFILSSEVLF